MLWVRGRTCWYNGSVHHSEIAFPKYSAQKHREQQRSQDNKKTVCLFMTTQLLWGKERSVCRNKKVPGAFETPAAWDGMMPKKHSFPSQAWHHRISINLQQHTILYQRQKCKVCCKYCAIVNLYTRPWEVAKVEFDRCKIFDKNKKKSFWNIDRLRLTHASRFK